MKQILEIAVGVVLLACANLPAIASSEAGAEVVSKASAAAIAEPGVVEIETRDEDGDARITKIWIVSEGETIYVRTVDSNWNANLEREPTATLHSDAFVAATRVTKVLDADVQAKVNALFAEKYGIANTLRNLAVSLGTANMWALTLPGS